MTYETIRAELRALCVDVINISRIGTIKAHLALSDPTRIPALQIVDAIIHMQEVRAAFTRTYQQYVSLSIPYVQAGKKDKLLARSRETQELDKLFKQHNMCMRSLEANEKFFYGELYLRAKQPIEHASALQTLGLLAKRLVSAPEAFNQGLKDFKATLMQP
jgi:hypothetical protein